MTQKDGQIALTIQKQSIDMDNEADKEVSSSQRHITGCLCLPSHNHDDDDNVFKYSRTCRKYRRLSAREKKRWMWASGGITAMVVVFGVCFVCSGLATTSSRHRLLTENTHAQPTVSNERTVDKYLLDLESVAEHCLGEDEAIEIDLSKAESAEERENLMAKAQSILRHCKVLVLRNAIPREYMDETLIPKVSLYLDGIASGEITSTGQSTNGEARYFSGRDAGRWEVLLPENLVHETKKELVMNPFVLNILKAKKLLGESMALMSGGINFASAGAVGQRWHEDERYIFEEDSFQVFGIAGHDIPATAITVSIPLLDVTPAHGPTEFCLGSSAIQGLSYNGFNVDYVRNHVNDKSLVAEGSVYDRFVRHGYGTCHPHFWKSPVLRKGDVLMFDYQLKHRGGANQHPHDARSILFFTYSRYWFKDSNFHQEPTPIGFEKKEWEILKAARLAKPDNWDFYSMVHKDVQEKAKDIREIGPLDPTNDVKNVFPSEGEEFTFEVSNKDILGTDINLFWNNEKVGPLPRDATLSISKHIHEGQGNFSIRNRQGQSLYEFKVKQSAQVIFHTGMASIL